MATQALTGPALKIVPSGANLTTAGTAFGAGDTITLPNDGRSCLLLIVSATGGTAALKASGSVAADVPVTLTASSIIAVGPFAPAYGGTITVTTATATGTAKVLALPAGQSNLLRNAFESDPTQLDSV